MSVRSYVSQELSQSIQYQRMNLSDTEMKTWGIYRYAPGGVIEEAKYDYVTQRIGPYQFQEYYGYVQEFYTKKACPPKDLLYRYMLELDCVLACIFVNNTFVARVMEDRIEYINLEKPTGRDVKFFSTPLEHRYLMDIGWVKTRMKCFSVATLPWRLHMDITNNKAYIGNGQWVDIAGQPEYFMQFDFSLYKQLLEQPTAVAVYRDLNDGQAKYL